MAVLKGIEDDSSDRRKSEFASQLQIMTDQLTEKHAEIEALKSAIVEHAKESEALRAKVYDTQRENEALKTKLEATEQRKSPRKTKDKNTSLLARLSMDTKTRRSVERKSGDSASPLGDKESTLRKAETARAEWAQQMASIERVLKKEAETVQLKAAKEIGNYMTPYEVACLRKLANLNVDVPVHVFIRLMEEFRILDPSGKGHVKTTDVEDMMPAKATDNGTIHPIPEEYEAADGAAAAPAPDVAAVPSPSTSKPCRLDILLPADSTERSLAYAVLTDLVKSHGDDGDFDFYAFAKAVLVRERELSKDTAPKRKFRTLRDLVHAAVEQDKKQTEKREKRLSRRISSLSLASIGRPGADDRNKSASCIVM